MTNATSGGTNPGVCSSEPASSMYWRKSVTTFFSCGAFAASALSAADPDGGVGGRSLNWSSAPIATTNDASVITSKYWPSPAWLCAIAPPTRKAVAMPT